DSHGLQMVRVKQENARPFREGSHEVGHAQELGHLPRQRNRDLTLEAGLSLAKVGLEEAEGEEVAVPGGPPGLSEEEVKKCLLLQQACRRIKKGGHHSSPFFSCQAVRRGPGQ